MRFRAGQLLPCLACGSLFNYATRKSEKFVRARADGVEDTLELEHCLLFGVDVSATFTRTILVIPPAVPEKESRSDGEEDPSAAEPPRVPGFRLVSVTCGEEPYPVLSPHYTPSLTVAPEVAASCEALLREARHPESLAHVKVTSKCRPLEFPTFSADAPSVVSAEDPENRRDRRRPLRGIALAALEVAQQHLLQLSDGYAVDVREIPANEDDPDLCAISKGNEEKEKVFIVMMPAPSTGGSVHAAAWLLCLLDGAPPPFNVDELIFASPLAKETCQEVSDRIDPKLMCLTAVDSLATVTDQKAKYEPARSLISSGPSSISFYKTEGGNEWTLGEVMSQKFAIYFSDERRTSTTTYGSVSPRLIDHVENEARRLVTHLNAAKDNYAELAGFEARPGSFLGQTSDTSNIQFSPESLALRIHEYSGFSLLKTFQLL